MIRRPPRSTRTDTLFPYTTRFRSARFGEEGVDLAMVDSTNADVPGFTPPERDIGPVIEAVMAKATRRVVVASFSRHVHRVQQVLDAAAAHGRQVALAGRPMVPNMSIASDQRGNTSRRAGLGQEGWKTGVAGH